MRARLLVKHYMHHLVAHMNPHSEGAPPCGGTEQKGIKRSQREHQQQKFNRFTHLTVFFLQHKSKGCVYVWVKN